MYYGILLITLVTAVPILSKSSTTHNLRKTYSSKRAAPLDCRRTPEELHNYLTSEELPTIPLHDSGVYFVPSNVISFQTQVTDLSFLISNPMNFVSKIKTSRTKKEFQPKEEFHNQQSDLVTSYDKETHKQDNSKTTEIPPLYLDLDVQAVSNKERSSLQEITFIKDLETTERALDECFDLYVLDYTRKYGIVEELKEFWDTNNLKKYDDMTNSDLNERRQKYCKKPEYIFEQSLRDIKKGVLKRKADNLSNTKKSNKHVTSTISPSSSDLDNQFLLTNLPLIMSKSIEDVATADIVDMDTTLTNRNNTEMITSGGNFVTTEHNAEILDLDKPFKMSKIADGEIIKNNDFDMDTMASEVIFVTDNYNKIAFEATNKEPNLDETTLYTLTSTTPQEELLMKNIVDDGDVLTDVISTTPILPYESIKKKDNDISIPKLTTKECKNNTVLSLIDGYEILPDNDFMKQKTTQDKSPNNNSMADIKLLKENTTNRDPILYDSGYISGNIYFGTDNELVPIRLQPTDNGRKIHLSIDGDSLCDKLFRNTSKKSFLLATLCELHQNVIRQNSTDEH